MGALMNYKDSAKAPYVNQGVCVSYISVDAINVDQSRACWRRGRRGGGFRGRGTGAMYTSPPPLGFDLSSSYVS